MAKMTFEKRINKVNQKRRKKWTARDYALKLSEEVGEVAQCFNKPSRREGLAEECADVYIVLMGLVDRAGIDLAAAVDAKVAKNESS